VRAAQRAIFTALDEQSDAAVLAQSKSSHGLDGNHMPGSAGKRPSRSPRSLLLTDDATVISKHGRGAGGAASVAASRIASGVSGASGSHGLGGVSVGGPRAGLTLTQRVTQVAAGADFGLALTSSGQVLSWGDNSRC